MKKASILILSTQGNSLLVCYNYLKHYFDIEQVIIENSYSKKKLLKYRIKKQGFITVLGQILFLGFAKLLRLSSKNRITQLLNSKNIKLEPIPETKISFISSVNSKVCRNLLKGTSADFILVNGTRIISSKTLNSTCKKFVNIHAGITPKYRGVHGGYWSLAEQDFDNNGTTLHYIDEGVDTGDIIAQTLISPSKKDNFTTYPLLQQIKGLELLIHHSNSILTDEKGYSRRDLPSKQWFHPTIWGYLFRRINNGVK